MAKPTAEVVALGVLVAGEGGSVLVAASLAAEPPDVLACEGLAHPTHTPDGVPAWPAEALPDGTDLVRLLPCEPATRRRLEDAARSRGVRVEQASVPVLDAPEGVRVVAVSSPGTGAGKTGLVRRVARGLRRSGVAVAVVRHPLPNVLLWPERAHVEVVSSPEDLDRARPLCEVEELAPLVGAGVPVATGLDPRELLRAVTEAAGGDRPVVVWDGGGAAIPWVKPDFSFVVLDAIRDLPPGTEERVRAADAVVVAKVDSAPEERTRAVEDAVRSWNSQARIILADLLPQVPDGPQLIGRRVVCVEDAPSLLVGGLRAGAAAVAARRFRCGVVDPRPFAVGAVDEVLSTHAHIGPVVPTVGRTQAERDDLVRTIEATPGDAVLWASPADPAAILGPTERPVHRVLPELMEVAGPSLQEVLQPFLPGGVA